MAPERVYGHHRRPAREEAGVTNPRRGDRRWEAVTEETERKKARPVVSRAQVGDLDAMGKSARYRNASWNARDDAGAIVGRQWRPSTKVWLL